MQSRLDDGFLNDFMLDLNLEFLEQVRNSEAFKQKMAELQALKANEKK